MDVSSVLTIILSECDANRGISFENHLYGCFALAEHITSPSGEQFDISEGWASIGIQYGFFSDKRCVYEGSAAYKEAWRTIFQTASAEFVEALEDATFKPLCLKGTIFFAGALSTGELPETLSSLAASLLVEPVVAVAAAVDTAPQRRLQKTRGRRIVTPAKIHRFNKTRKMASSTGTTV
jgi:hypothetical protein